jgi:hypothetical protein
MSTTQEQPAASTDGVVAYYERTAETGELLAVLLQGLGVPLHAISLMGAKMVSVALTLIAQNDKEIALKVRDELAEGFMGMLERLDLNPGGEGGAKN